MKKNCSVLLSCLLLSACSGFNEERADAFQSLSQAQQAHYWQEKKVALLSKQLKALGAILYTQGDENQIIIPASALFNSNTPPLQNRAKPILKAIAALINAQSTAAVNVLTYAQYGNSTERNFALTQSWAESIVDSLRQQGLLTGLVSAQGHGSCDNIGTANALTNRVEIHYRVAHED
jgi:outer membrane protein OmpA-like peptidoglycan-associated protein